MILITTPPFNHSLLVQHNTCTKLSFYRSLERGEKVVFDTQEETNNKDWFKFHHSKHTVSFWSRWYKLICPIPYDSYDSYVYSTMIMIVF